MAHTFVAPGGQTILPLSTTIQPRWTRNDPRGPAVDGTTIFQIHRTTLRTRTGQKCGGERQIGRGRRDQVVPYLRVDEGRGFAIEHGESGLHPSSGSSDLGKKVCLSYGVGP